MTNIMHQISQSYHLSDSHLRIQDLKEKKYIIYLGGAAETCEYAFKNEPDRIVRKRALSFPSYEAYISSDIEAIISHESIHISIYKQTEDISTAIKFDNIDSQNEITIPVIVDIEQ